LVQPSEAILTRQFDVAALAADESRSKEKLLDEHLRRTTTHFDACDPLALELEDFLESIRAHRAPRVTGEDGRDAVALAERILRKIYVHAWDGQPGGVVGPLATARPPVIPAPHFILGPAPYREAG
jgi:hypothetical protein